MNTIYLITEGQKDVYIVLSLVNKKYPHIRIEPILPERPNLSRLASQIEKLIQRGIQRRERGDCIVVLHDADLQTRPHNRQDYERIREICAKYSRDVKHIIAYDEIESWLLADSGLCSWLEIKAGSYDEARKPSEKLINLLDSARKPKYTLPNLKQILQHLDGTGERYSLSLRDAMALLENAPCTKTPSK